MKNKQLYIAYGSNINLSNGIQMSTFKRLGTLRNQGL